MTKPALAFVPLVVLLACLACTACKSKSAACAKVSPSFDPIAKDLDAVAKAADTAPPPSPADQASCAQLTERLQRIESAEGKLSLIVTDDAMLAKHLSSYRQQVSLWAKATQKAQLGCLGRDGNAMSSGISKAIEARSQLTSAAADITSYCKAP
jgi:hypothetical protein